MAQPTLTADSIGDLLASLNLGLKPRIKTTGGLSAALSGLAHCKSLRKKCEAEIEAQINNLREQQTRALTLTLAGKPIGLDTYERTLTEAIESFVLERRDEVFGDGTQTVSYPAGTIALKSKPPWLQFGDGVTKKSVVAETVEAESLLPKIENWLKRLGLRPWLKLVPDLDTTAITQAIKSGELNNEDLADWGLTFQGAETVVIKPADYTAATT